jgi:hypothetical protein
MIPAINSGMLVESTQFLRLRIISIRAIIVDPKNSGINQECKIYSLIEFIARIALDVSILPNAGITKLEKAKYIPAIRPLLIAAVHSRISISKTGIMLTSDAEIFPTHPIQ